MTKEFRWKVDSGQEEAGGFFLKAISKSSYKRLSGIELRRK